MRPLDEVVRHIRTQRRLLNISQSALAKDAGTSQSFIAKLEQSRLNPSYTAVRDVLLALERYERREEPTARQLMQREPAFVSPTEAVGRALDIMKLKGYSQLPVVEAGRPVGSFSETIVLDHLERGDDLADLRAMPVERVMRGNFPTVEPATGRHALVELLRSQALVLVVDGRHLVGVVSKADLW